MAAESWPGGRMLSTDINRRSDLVETPGAEDLRPLIAHVIFRLDVGGLENGLVNLINGLPAERYRHAIVCIDDHTAFASRISRDDVAIVAIHKKPGTDLSALWRLYKTFRQLQPLIVHTRNLAALDALLPAMLAGVKWRIHGEHGWDVNDLGGHNRKLRLLRKLHAPLVSRYIALSGDLLRYLQQRVGVRAERIVRICNGVDVDRFRPELAASGSAPFPRGFVDHESLVIGTVGRLQSVKDPLNLVDAFGILVEKRPDIATYAKLVIVGDGILREAVHARVRDRQIDHLAWLPGERHDIAELMRAMDIFVQPSLAEGISNTILEAMASGLPVIATNVGGNSELVDDQVTGILIPPADSPALARALEYYVDNPDRRKMNGSAARKRAVARFSIGAMIGQYQRIYDELLRLSVPN